MRLDEVVKRGRELLGDVCEDSLGEVRYVVEGVWGFERSYQHAHAEEEVSEEGCQKFFEMVERRREGEPLALILGRCAFYGLWFEVSEETLQPREDTEVMVDWVFELYEGKKKPLWVVDLGTGSGCLLVSVLKGWRGERVRGVGIDKSEKAIRVARRNGVRHGVGEDVSWMVGDWSEALAEDFFGKEEVLVLSNPPYVRSGDREDLWDCVRYFEPRLAWDGGESGLESIEEVMGRRCLGGGERLLMEIGWDQMDDVRKGGESAGWNWCGSRSDLGGVERIVMWERVSLEKA